MLILAKGVTARLVGSNELVCTAPVESLRKHAKTAMNILGACGISFADFPDNRMDSIPLLDVVRAVEQEIGRLKPDVVFTHHRGDLNVDHRVTAMAVETATRPMAGCPVRALYAFEAPSSTEWAFGRAADAFCPNYFVDIAATLAKKVEALKAYRTEIRDFPHPRSSEGIEALARWRGAQSGLGAAEAFAVVRSIEA